MKTAVKYVKNNKKTISCVLYILIVVVFFVAVYVDIQPYLVAREGLLKSATTLKAMQERQSQIDSDMDLILDCKTLGDSEHGMSQSGRDCLVAAMPKMATFEGAISIGTLAPSWLTKNSNDSEFRDSAIKVVAAGWEDLRRTAPLFKAIDVLVEAHDNSFFLKIFHGEISSSETGFIFRANMLDKAELSISDPELITMQENRRLKDLQAYDAINL
jgi:hypothetical protein